MAEKVDELMRKEKRTRSELFREALRRYFEEQEWKEIKRYGRMKAKEKGISEDQIEDIVDAIR
jgi:CopG family transcriptional regulator / antitoxin EndoAI